ncbi:TIGR04282 family arsenosugar biosynthesis glycosyltransferase [Amycolatopsis magusensis]|uniref:TIGR04282 family arsenosugar biosynthesis glycosyltransferase n=1 Tax=Amycolatopsis magusensis TaxID=882444 RepID=UPI003C2F2F59
MTTGVTLAVVLCKPPGAPNCKTRLVRDIGHRRAEQVYRECLEHVLTVLTGFGFPIRLAVDGAPLDLAPHCARAGVRHGELVRQRGETFQERQAHELRRGLADGHDRVLLCASDLPDLARRVVVWAVESAEAGHVGIVPSPDGGYSLLSTPSPLPELTEVPMSTTGTGQALAATLRRAGHSVRVAPYQVRDVDVAEDLATAAVPAAD